MSKPKRKRIKTIEIRIMQGRRFILKRIPMPQEYPFIPIEINTISYDK